MKLEKAPVLNLFRLEIDPKNHENYTQKVEEYMLNADHALFMQSGHEDQKEYKNYLIESYQDDAAYQQHEDTSQVQQFEHNLKDIVTSQVKVELYPEFISTKPEKLAVTHDNDYVVYLTEIGVQLGKGDEFANAVMKEMKTAVEKEDGILAMIAGTIMNQPNEWFSLEVYRTEEAYEEHLKTKHFKKYLEATKYSVESKGLHLLKPDCIVDQGEIFYRP
ncbi:putative quinol monooxygenase [Lactobacillus gallinarum]|uniref:putative quinol monooxygenase n=1 Tax=Lactobacillus gallinarum TaxID=52242 RepID=UPI000B397185|nr:antibiotic biosynthesis monooxygenase family protein [Lactobacillus gallinarum]MCC9272421.1 antibiotic biosynthesis monooxygenase [Lactobacillus gallinarum]OUQ50666.1 antibiotic biosynthesis monooxygenase [Lactobacillus gallinarum]